MSPAPRSRTQPCDAIHARKRLEDARKFLEVAEMVDDEPIMISAGVSAAIAVLAGIAASDAACCAVLGYRPRGDDHREAVSVLTRVSGSSDAARSLSRLLAIKNDAQYGLTQITPTKRKTALRLATNLVGFAETTVAGAG